jgi:ribosomal-protein-alanine N-acetyltransferase
MSWPEILECKGFRLRAWRMDDVDSLVRHANDPLVSRSLGHRFPYPYTDEDARIFISQSLHLPDEKTWAIEINGEASGGIGVHPGEGVERYSAELGYWLGRAYWNEGIATAAVAAMVPHAMREMRLYRLQARVFEDNLASMRVMEKCGFIHEATLHRLVVKEGRVLDMLIYAIIRDSLERESLNRGESLDAQ